MNTTEDEIKRILSESRNGMNQAIRYNPFTPRFLISDGVKELADAAGCYWLLDILATELEPKLMALINLGAATTAIVKMVVLPGQGATIIASLSDDEDPPFYSRHIEYTDFPEGEWVLFEVGAFEWDMESERAKNIIAILLSEH